MAKFQHKYVNLRDYNDEVDYRKLFGYGEEGWELVCIHRDVAVFKRAYDEDRGVEEALQNLYEMLGQSLLAVGQELAGVKTRETMLIGLLEALVEKVNPDSEYLKALKEEREKLQQAPEAAPIPTEEASADDDKASKFAEEQIALVMKCYESEDKSLDLFSRLIGLGGLLPLQTAEGHYSCILKAFYRYYEQHHDHRAQACFTDALARMAAYLSSPETIQTLNQIAEANMTIDETTDMFFGVLRAQLAFEKDGTAPFVIDAQSLIQTFVDQIKGDAVLCADEALLAKIRACLSNIRSEYNVECADI